jgi:hypothetical protein
MPTATTMPTLSPTPAAAEPLLAAIAASRRLSQYRMAFSAGSEQGDERFPIIEYTASFDGSQVAFRVQSPAHGSGSQELQVIISEGITYARGPLPLSGAEQAVWYNLGAQPPAATRPPLTLDQLLGLITGKIDLAAFRDDGEILHDGQNCTRYRAGLAAALGMFDSLGRPTTAEAMAAEATPVVERMQAQGIRFGDSEALILVCDGLVTHVRSTVDGEGMPGRAGTFRMMLSLDVTADSEAMAFVAPLAPLQPGERAVMATVANGGNLRAAPSLQGAVQDQIHAAESVRLLGRSADGRWYKIINLRDQAGWVSATLLSIDQEQAVHVPVTTPSPK